MKIALLADIHANFAALQTVAAEINLWRPDLVIVAGDLVNRGPKPRECLEFVYQRIREQNWYWLRGNHEEYVLEQAKTIHEPGNPAAEVHRASCWTMEQLNSWAPDEESSNSFSGIHLLKQMPFQLNLLDPSARLASFVHASLQGIREGIYPEMTDEAIKSHLMTHPAPLPHEQTDWIGMPSSHAPLSLFGVGHTHRPVIRRLDEALVVNAGSAGLPFDQDTRPSYARLTFHKGEWSAEICRFTYDLEQAEKDFYTTGYLENGGPLVKLVLIELRTAQSQLYHWAIRYQEHALKGEISMSASVDRYLSLD